LKTDVENKKLYEAMFLVDSDDVASDWEGVNDVIQKMMLKADAEIVSIKKWDDRRLAYEIKGKSRGTYILCYFRADGQKIREIERAVQLSERIMRVLILRAEGMGQEDIEMAGISQDSQAQEEPLKKDDGTGAQEDTSTVQDKKRKRKATETSAEVEAEQPGESGPAEQTEEEIEEAD
jgi:small subunit ribosomal protein S6